MGGGGGDADDVDDALSLSASRALGFALAAGGVI